MLAKESGLTVIPVMLVRGQTIVTHTVVMQEIWVLVLWYMVYITEEIRCFARFMFQRDFTYDFASIKCFE